MQVVGCQISHQIMVLRAVFFGFSSILFLFLQCLFKHCDYSSWAMGKSFFVVLCKPGFIRVITAISLFFGYPFIRGWFFRQEKVWDSLRKAPMKYESKSCNLDYVDLWPNFLANGWVKILNISTENSGYYSYKVKTRKFFYNFNVVPSNEETSFQSWSVFQSSYITHYNLQFLELPCNALYICSMTCGYKCRNFVQKLCVHTINKQTKWWT